MNYSEKQQQQQKQVSICDNVNCITSLERVSHRLEDQERKSLTTIYVNSNTSVLLQTAVGVVFSVSQPHTALTMRNMFDRGSQRSYLMEYTRKGLI